MITKGIVEEVLDNKVRIRLPIYDGISGSSNSTKKADLNIATICSLPNASTVVSENDIVWVGFEDNDESKPIILGHLYKSKTKTKASLEIGSLKTDSVTKLNSDTYIGKVTPKEINCLVGISDNIEKRFKTLEENTDILGDTYLPLKAGSATPLTGSLYVKSENEYSSVYLNNAYISSSKNNNNLYLIAPINKSIKLHADGKTNTTTGVEFSGDGFYPEINKGVNLGTSNKVWNNVYASEYYRNDIKIIDFIYPIGSIYISVVATDPSNLFGGTWKQLKDTFLLAHGDSYTSTKSANNDQVKAEAGSATHTLTIDEIPSHDHAIDHDHPKFTMEAADGAHTHGFQTDSFDDNATGMTAALDNSNNDKSDDFTLESGGAHKHTIDIPAYTGTSGSRGGSKAHNNMPPYLVVYMWKRIA